MNASKKFTVSQKIFEEAVATKLNIDNKDVEIHFNNYDELVINVKRGLLSEAILLTDDIVYEILEIDKNELEFDYMNYADDNTFHVDDDLIIEVYIKDPSDLKEVA